MIKSVEERIKKINGAETPEDLKKCLCPFFEKGACPDCVGCRKTEADLDECKEFYMSHIFMHPKDLWDEEFETMVVQTRDQVSLDDVVGIGSNCDNCYMYDKCPMYKKGFACAIKWDSNKPKNSNEFMDFLIGMQYERVRRAAVFEKIDGGVPDAGLSGEMDRLSDYLNMKDNMGRDRLSINVEASGAAQPSGGGILAKLFGGGSAAPQAKTIEAKPKPDFDVAEFQEIKEEPVKVPRKKKEK